ncbi:MAG TPA: toll/interleukin-1 receptor domain-containing protein [Steroidobacteraceae bacterium]
MQELSHAYWAFLSYSSGDRALAKWLQRALETYAVPRRLVGRTTPAGPAPRYFRPIFRDRTELAADPDLIARIATALAESAYLIVLCSPHAAKSHWVHEEIVRFRELHGDARILTVILDGSPQSDQVNCFPPALRYRADPSSAKRPEPIAADLRPNGDGRRMTRLKLLAGMLGVGLDELVRRDIQRRNRQLIAITAASLTGVMIATALATAALIARNNAQRQRAHAEGLIEFNLTDLRKKLEPGGRLDAMDGVGREALKYYEAQRPEDLDEQSLARRARALRLMGEIGIKRGDLSEALISFEQASATTSELLLRAPTDGQIVFNHAQNVFWVGEVARQRGDIKQAEASFEQYLTLAQRLRSIDAGNDDWHAEVGYAQSALGVLFLQVGRVQEATAAFEPALEVAQDLARRRPGDLSLQLALGQSHAWLADALQKAGRLAKTRTHRETELQIYQAILAKDGTIRQAKYSTIVALHVLGDLARLNGEESAALARFSAAAAGAEALLVNEPNNMELAAVAAINQINLGECMLAARQSDGARAAQQRADALLSMALSHDAAVARWRNYREREELLKASIAAQSGQRAEALQIDQSVLNRLGVAAGSVPNTEAFLLLERSRLQTGDDLSALARAEEAHRNWSEIVKTLPGPVESYEPTLLDILAAAQTRLGHPQEAQAITKRLRSLSQAVDDDRTLVQR